MFRTSLQKPDDRRGAVLLIVLGLLFLFAALGITFAITSKVESQAARNFKRGSHLSDSGAPPAAIDMLPEGLMKFALSQLIYDTDNSNSALRGHSLLRDMYGGPHADPRVFNTASDPNGDYLPTGPFHFHGPDNKDFRNGWLNAFNGVGIETVRASTGTTITIDDIRTTLRFPFTDLRGQRFIPNGGPPIAVPTAGAPYNGIRYPFNFTLFDEIVGSTTRANTSDPVLASTALDAAGNPIRVPERYYYDAAQEHYFAYDEDYDAADFNNWFLALERPDGTILVPSFHRPHLVAQLAYSGSGPEGTGNAANTIQEHVESPNSPWNLEEGWRFVLRPRRREYAGGDSVAYTPADQARYAAGTGFNPDYNGWRDLPLDPTGPYLNIGGTRYAAIWGDQPSELDVDTDGDGLRDAIWVDLGYPPQQFGTDWVKPLFAFKVIDLDGKLNLNVHGNFSAGSDHHSNLGASAAEINLKSAFKKDDSVYQNLLHGDTMNNIRGRWNPASGTFADTDRAGDESADDDDITSTMTGGDSPNPPPSQIYNRLLFSDTNSPIYNATIGQWTYPDVETPSNNVDLSRHPGYTNDGRHRPAFDNQTRFEEMFTSSMDPLVSNNPPDLIDRINSVFSWGRRDLTGSGILNMPSGMEVFPDLSTYPAQTDMATDEATEFNPYDADGDDSPFTASQVEALLRLLDIDGTALDQRAVRLLASNVETSNNATDNYIASRVRRMLTHASWDLTHYNASPSFINGNTTDPDDPPGWEDQSQRPTLNPTTIFPFDDGAFRHNGMLDGAIYDFGVRTTPDEIRPNPYATAPGTPQFIVNPIQRYIPKDASGANLTDAMGTEIELDIYPTELLHGRRFNINRPLRKYRDPTTRGTPGYTNVGAEVDRQILASQLYMLIRIAAHIQDGDNRAYAAAQLAANIVDFIDPDDVITRFEFDLTLADVNFQPVEVVYGTELPRLVINEASAFYYWDFAARDADTTDVWTVVELRNPVPDSNASGDEADLQVGVAVDNLGGRIHSRSLEGNYRVHVKYEVAGDVHDPAPHDFDRANARDGNLRIGHDTYFTLGPDPTMIGLPGVATGTPVILTDGIEMPEDLNYVEHDVFHHQFSPTSAPDDVKVTISLLRLRNPYEPESFTNPYVVVDQFHLANDVGDGEATDGVYNLTRLETDDPTGPDPMTDTDPARESENNAVNDAGTRLSRQRQSPWIGHWETDQVAGDDLRPIANTGMGADENTFGDVNTVDSAPDAAQIVFLNRELASPLELLHVPFLGGNDPEEVAIGGGNYRVIPVTRDFDPEDITSSNARVPWFRDDYPPTGAGNMRDAKDQTADLYRLFEYIEVPSRFRGSGFTWQPLRYPDDPDSAGGANFAPGDFIYPDLRVPRVPGKINLNTVTAQEVFLGLLSPNESATQTAWAAMPFDTLYSSADVGALANFGHQFPFNGSGTQGASSANTIDHDLFRTLLFSRAGADLMWGTGDDKPFRSFASGRIADTYLRPRDVNLLESDNVSATEPRLFDPIPGSQSDLSEAFERNELLAKIGGNITTRSNVFGVWVTVGFFQVIPGTETLNVPLLDREVGIDDGTSIRHRGFFIIDRSLASSYSGPLPQSITNYSDVPMILLNRTIE